MKHSIVWLALDLGKSSVLPWLGWHLVLLEHMVQAPGNALVILFFFLARLKYLVCYFSNTAFCHFIEALSPFYYPSKKFSDHTNFFCVP